MTLVEFLILLLVAGMCGVIGQAIGGYSFGGLLVAIALGFIGALLGVWMARTFGLPEPLMMQFGDVVFPVIWSIVGATLFVLVVGLLRYPYRRI